MTNLGATARKQLVLLIAAIAALALGGLSQAAMAQEVAETVESEAVAEAPAYTPLGPDMIKGQPEPGAINVQPQFSALGQEAYGLHMGLVWIMVIISVFVLGLLLWVIVRYNKRANPTPSKTSHNTLIEVLWTVVPVLILVGIAVPSMRLLANQYETPPEDALTVKVTGNQWSWTYAYPDNGGFEFTSLMLNEPGAPVVNNQVREVGTSPYDGPPQLEVDNRMVLPVGVPIRLQTTASDVIHSFAVPAIWFKIDAVPGRLNERIMQIDEPGIYYGQCSELCGAKHGYMPIAIEAVPMEQFEAWVLSRGGTIGGEEAAAVPVEAVPAEADAADEAAPAEEPAPAV